MRVSMQRLAAVAGAAAVGGTVAMLLHTHTRVIGEQVLWALPFVIAAFTGTAKTTTV